MIIDVFCKYGWATPWKTKTGSEVAKALQDLWERHAQPQKQWADKGKELYNKQMKDLPEKNNIHVLNRKRRKVVYRRKMEAQSNE